ncbi:hypothetical protein [Escherichia coli]|uniref:hypothetical protein n=1 Tax=Escherichia coli TaxID=562 RepID=UPI001CCB3093|nr:hypothetical protein [Escherichia coli]UBO42274.1 hypothetical protein LCE24_22335 [Escherichia coli]
MSLVGLAVIIGLEKLKSLVAFLLTIIGISIVGRSSILTSISPAFSCLLAG